MSLSTNGAMPSEINFPCKHISVIFQWSDSEIEESCDTNCLVGRCFVRVMVMSISHDGNYDEN